MASHVFVTDSSARRHQVKTTPASYLRDVLDEACKKFNKDPEQFMLTDNSRPPKILDLSLTLRLSGLVNGAKLQLVQASRSPSVINVALKLPLTVGDGQRLQDKFPSNTSLWLILRKLEEAVAGGVSQKLNLTQRAVPSTETGAGRLEYEQPVIKIMQREMADFVGLQKSLAQLGYNTGSVLLQLEFRKSGIPMEEAVAQISQYFDIPASSSAPAGSLANETGSGARKEAATSNLTVPTEPIADAQHVVTTTTDSPAPAVKADHIMSDAPPLPHASELVEGGNSEVVAGPDEHSKQPTQAENTQSVLDSTSQETATTSDRANTGIFVYKAPSASTPKAALQSSSESDFVPTIEHAHAHQAVLNRAAQNQRLLSDAEVAAESARKQEVLLSVRSATVRVRFPDQMQVDSSIAADATPESLYTRVRDMLHDPSLNFELRFTGDKGAPVTLAKEGPEANRKLIRNLGWKGRVLVTMVWAPDVPPDGRVRVLKDSLVGQARELSVPAPLAPGGEAGGKTLDGRVAKAKEQSKGGNTKADVEAKMKKFLGFGKGKK